MSKGGSKAPSTAGLEKATAEATALQREMFEQGREDLQPWYRTGAAGMGRLADLLGIEGGSVMGREDIYQELLPQYTTQQQTGGAGMWLGSGGQLYGSEEQAVSGLSLADRKKMGFRGLWGDKPSYGGLIKQYEGGGGQDTIDREGLNAAIEARMAAQAAGGGARPEGYGSLLERFDLGKYEADPGYQFRQDEAQKALERSMAAQGVTLGGGGYGTINPQVARALEEQRQNLASQEYGQAYNRYNIDQSNVYNRLLGVAGLGQGSAAQQVQMGGQLATNVGNLGTGLAGAQFQAQQAAAARPSMFSQLLGAAAQIAPAAIAASDIRLKENIEFVGKDKGHNVYEFSYKNGDGRFRGVMAHEVLEIDPDAVMDIGGYLAVNYDKIGLKMEQVNGV